MNSPGDCEVVILPKGRAGAVSRMSADAYINRMVSQTMVDSRLAPWMQMTGSTASCCDGYRIPHLLAFSAIFLTLRMSL